MLSVLADENFNHRILRGIKLRISALDVVVARSVGLSGQKDPNLLAWAADQGRIVLTHDRQTMPKCAYDRIRSRQPMLGIIVVSNTMPVGEAIEILTLYLECGANEDFANLVLFFR